MYKEYWGSPAGGVPAALIFIFFNKGKEKKRII
jgi:hypothetical protein